jgi:hypothetical protein
MTYGSNMSLSLRDATVGEFCHHGDVESTENICLGFAPTRASNETSGARRRFRTTEAAEKCKKKPQQWLRHWEDK